MADEMNDFSVEIEPDIRIGRVSEQTIEVAPDRAIPPPPLKNPVPSNLTEEQGKRDEQMTALFSQFVEAHKDKQIFSKESKTKIRSCCIVWVFMLILACIGLSFYIIMYTDRLVGDVVALIGAIIPLVMAVIGTLNIVIKHVFPENEEQYITDLVKTLSENDLKNKQVNLSNMNK